MRAVLRRLCLALLGAGLALTVITLPAAAGGPSSVLLVNPGTGSTASLYATEVDYQLLGDLVGASSLPEGGQPAATPGVDGETHEGSTSVTVTWLIHDVQVWRVDRIQLDAAGGPWVASQVAGDSGDVWDGAEVWHVVTRGKELALLLDRLGVGSAATTAAAAPAPVVAPAQVAAASVAAQAAPAPGQALDDGRDNGGGAGLYLAGLGGLVTGAALTLGTLRHRQRRPEREGAAPPSEGTPELEFELLDPR